mgnify:CR=1 FL=1
MKAVVIHSNRENEAKEIQRELEQEYPHIEWSLSYFGAVIGTHLGEGAIGIGWYKKSKNDKKIFQYMKEQNNFEKKH